MSALLFAFVWYALGGSGLLRAAENGPDSFLKDAAEILQVDVPSFTPREEDRLGETFLLGEFQRFKKLYGRQYPSKEEERQRFANFAKNQAVAAILQKTEQGTARYGTTQFSDLSKQEFTERYLTSVLKKMHKPTTTIQVKKSKKAPASCDWRKKGAVTPVKNQGEMGSSVPFAYATNIEGLHFVTEGTLLEVNITHLCQCSELARVCRRQPSNIQPQKNTVACCQLFNGAESWCADVILSKKESEIAEWIATNAPAYAALNALTLMTYVGGIAHPNKTACNPDQINHAVGIVGYGTENGVPFWIAKNSWGANWGEEGYFRMYRGDGTCGINQMVMSAVLSKNPGLATQNSKP